MMEFGKSLRAAREAKGYTVLQLAEITHLAPSVVENLENEDFSHIAAPIYGRGFVKLYCEAVGLVPKPLIDQFMDILNGNHEPRIRERPVNAETPAAETTATPVCEHLPEPIPTPPPQQDLFRSQTPLNERKDLPPPPPAAAYAPPAAAAEPEPTVSRYASSFRMAQGVSPQRIWRTGALVLVALAVLVLLVFGLKALHRATSSAPSPSENAETPELAPVAAEESPAPKPSAQPATPRTAQNIPSLYID